MKRDVGILKDCADRDAELFAASVALPNTFSDGLLGIGARFQLASVIDLAAVRAYRAFGPAGRIQVACERLLHRQCGL